MSTFSIPKNLKTPCVVVASKMLHKGLIFGHISNGGGEISLGNGYSLRPVAHNEKFVTLQICSYGIGSEPLTQTWQKTKEVKETIKKQNLLDVHLESEEDELL